MECVVSLEVDLECDVVECNPAEESSSIIACGKYHLQESTKERIGAISLYEFDKNTGSLNNLQNVDRAGVLDCRWNNTGDRIITAEADGKIGLFNFHHSDNHLQFTNEFQLPSESITLAVDWNSSFDKCIGSYSDGNVVIINTIDGFQEESTFIAHEGAEVWAISSSKYSPHLFYSGGDDCKLKSWDSRMGYESSTFCKRYDMGVTCIQSSMHNEHYIVVGSYDETVSVFDIRNMRRPISDIRVGGGVWRIKWNPNNENILLSACMYNEFQLLEWKDNSISKLNDVFGSPQHEIGKLAYGADWFRYNTQNNNSDDYIALCSFYDKICSCWRIKSE